ncbi:MAG: hypothetical protein VXV74_06105, partial [Pseudomonadota bacterium]|nr:hypothetical protein [Pseudomonadota bacterium]
IEHNLEVIKTADWIIDIGPEGGDGGGEIVATGKPEDIATIKRSHTGTYLAPILKKTATQRTPKTTTNKAAPKPKKRTNQRPKAAE